MVTGYERLITMIYNDKMPVSRQLVSQPWQRSAPVTIGAPLLALPQVDPTIVTQSPTGR